MRKGTRKKRVATTAQDHTGELYSPEICPLGCCVKGYPVCAECVRGSCIGCGRHSHRGRPNWCTEKCAEEDALPVSGKGVVKDE